MCLCLLKIPSKVVYYNAVLYLGSLVPGARNHNYRTLQNLLTVKELLFYVLITNKCTSLLHI